MALFSWPSKDNKKRRRAAEDPRIVWLRRAGIVGGVVIFILWLGAWFVLTDMDTKTYNWIEQKTLTATGEIGYRVKDILVEGRVNADRQELLDIIGVTRGDPILKFDPQSVRDRLLAMNWVRAAQVERRLPDTIYIRLEERIPVALWKKTAQDKIQLVDDEGKTVIPADLRTFMRLPLVTGEGAPPRTPGLLALLEAEPEIKERVDNAQLIENRRWNLLLKSGAVVKLPEQDVGLALRTLALSHEKEQIMDWDINSIDLRDPGRIIFSTKLGKVREYKTGLGVAQAL
ncbi:MAG: FtsQ-type POTRA domain-containing protein [Rhodospirillales bacterium]|nr:FtsQ-type POTRA domain-containing protein [Alphaproteobacteria bacterium]MCB9976382.1 FtsQ-type POTRA domain-containing protein [Rhodospirillales bacterium]